MKEKNQQLINHNCSLVNIKETHSQNSLTAKHGYIVVCSEFNWALNKFNNVYDYDYNDNVCVPHLDIESISMKTKWNENIRRKWMNEKTWDTGKKNLYT